MTSVISAVQYWLQASLPGPPGLASSDEGRAAIYSHQVGSSPGRDGRRMLSDGEPPAGPWLVESVARFARRLLGCAGPQPGRPAVVAVDGHSGKTTVSERICAAVPESAVVSTDDGAWHHSILGWTDLLADGVLNQFIAESQSASDRLHGRSSLGRVPSKFRRAASWSSWREWGPRAAS